MKEIFQLQRLHKEYIVQDKVFPFHASCRNITKSTLKYPFYLFVRKFDVRFTEAFYREILNKKLFKYELSGIALCKYVR